MISKEQFKSGLLTYVDREVIPHLPTAGKWGVGSMIIIFSARFDKIYNSLMDNNVIKAIGITDENGMIDIDILMDAIRSSAERYGNMQISIPVIGTLTFSHNDIQKLWEYMGGNNG